ncbi:hypothetical protein DFH06DRAFT_1473989 [Mycena polygramma]|nr:hypothetical protein DFH06DRAFT_1473989 [Mycena polygramma]
MSTTQVSVQRQLNAVRDPVGRLPVELSSEIFVNCLPDYPQPGSRYIPMLLLNVCSAWSGVALSTRLLWATIHIVFPRSKGFAKFLRMWLKRAGSHLLSISLDGDFDEVIAALVWEHAAQLRSIEISYIQNPHVWTPAALGPFPFLEALTLGYMDESTDNGRQILEMLRHTPKLVELTFDWVEAAENDQTPTEKLVLPSLRCLEFGDENEVNLEGSADLLVHFTLPALETLVLATVSLVHVHSFLLQSSPPLRKLLFLGLDNDEITFAQLDECLQLVPLLTHLEFRDANTDLIDDFFDALAQGSSTLLPDLRVLKIDHCSYDMENFVPPAYAGLLRLLSIRRSQIRRFELILHADGISSYHGGPEAHLRSAFRQLVAGGMDIFIGDSLENFVEAPDEYSEENEVCDVNRNEDEEDEDGEDIKC